MTHGVRRSYVRGCRCQPCTTANRDYKRAHRLRTGNQAPGRPVEPSSVKDCGLCGAPIAAHQPYYMHQVSAPVMLPGEATKWSVKQPGPKVLPDPYEED